MNNLNSIILEGNITEDVKRPNAGAVRFEIASERQCAAKTEVSFVPVLAFGNMAGMLVGDKEHPGWGIKGQGVRVVGRIKQNRWTDADGKQWSELVLIAEHIEFKPRVKKAEEA